ncbi:reverse transcriptase (RNA-dependent DNA polymerase) domain-containing protein [Phthorimaea operculella]|nr:reverse transcriptase (RNA-dependent DNA polymerase) domain-containing protein [Phthorimaea operculella]
MLRCTKGCIYVLNIFDKEFDNVRHDKLISMLNSIGVDGETIRFIEKLHWNQQPKIKFNDTFVQRSLIEKGVRQGYILSPIIFNLYSETVFEKAFEELDLGIRVNGNVINNIRYADDTVLLAENLDDLQNMLDKLNNSLNEYGLKINTSKTKFMIVSKNTVPTAVPLQLGNSFIEKVKKYKYLGCWLNEIWEPEQEIKIRIEIARCTFQRMKKLFTNRKINLKLRWRMVKCYILPILMYGSESWTLKQHLTNKLRAFEMWLYRRMLKIKWTDKITSEKVLQIMKKDLEVVSTIKKRKAAYFGHIYRNSKYNLLQLIIEGKIEGKRGRGRRRISWTKNIRDWLKVDSTEKLIRMTSDRSTYGQMVADLRDGDGT